jgi:hypothetical protein
MPMAKNFAYLKRAFLNPPSSRKTSFVTAHVESSIHGSQQGISCVLQIADCNNPPITLDFYLGTARHRRESLAKARRLLRILNNFTEALKIEAELIENHKDELDKTENAER